MDTNLIRLNKEYTKSLAIAIFGIIPIHTFFWFNSNSRGEIISVFICSIISFALILIYNLIYLLPTRKLWLRLIFPGILTIITPLLIWNNKEVSINQYLIIGVLNLLLGVYFYIKKKKGAN